MNFKMLLKTVFLVLILLLLVIMGLNNQQKVPLSLPPIIKLLRWPAALMYFAFFAIGFVSGTILSAGKKGGGSARSKPAK